MNLDPQVIQAAAAMELKRRTEQERLRYYQRPLVHFKQRSVNRCNKRFRGVLGGNRAGKTVVGSVETVLFTLGRLAEPYVQRSEEHTSELQSRENLVCRLLLEKKNSSTSDV